MIERFAGHVVHEPEDKTEETGAVWMAAPTPAIANIAYGGKSAESFLIACTKDEPIVTNSPSLRPLRTRIDLD